MTCYDLLWILITFINQQYGRKSARKCWFFIISSLWSHLWPRHLLGARTGCHPPGARGFGTSGSPRSQCSSRQGWSSEQTRSHTTWPRPPENIFYMCHIFGPFSKPEYIRYSVFGAFSNPEYIFCIRSTFTIRPNTDMWCRTCYDMLSFTFVMRMFSGLTSLWRQLWRWQKLTAWRVCQTMLCEEKCHLLMFVDIFCRQQKFMGASSAREYNR